MGGAIVIAVLFAPEPFAIWISGALLCGFIAVGPLRWIDDRIQDIIDVRHKGRFMSYKNAMKIKSVWFLFFEIAFSLLGISLFTKGMFLLY